MFNLCLHRCGELACFGEKIPYPKQKGAYNEPDKSDGSMESHSEKKCPVKNIWPYIKLITHLFQ